MAAVYVKIGNRELPLRYDINAVTAVEEAHGGKSLVAMLANPAFLGFSLIRSLLWGGLKHKEKGLTLERTGSLIQEYLNEGGTMAELTDKIQQGLIEGGILKAVADEEENEEVK